MGYFHLAKLDPRRCHFDNISASLSLPGTVLTSIWLAAYIAKRGEKEQKSLLLDCL